MSQIPPAVCAVGDGAAGSRHSTSYNLSLLVYQIDRCLTRGWTWVGGLSRPTVTDVSNLYQRRHTDVTTLKNFCDNRPWISRFLTSCRCLRWPGHCWPCWPSNCRRRLALALLALALLALFLLPFKASKSCQVFVLCPRLVTFQSFQFRFESGIGGVGAGFRRHRCHH